MNKYMRLYATIGAFALLFIGSVTLSAQDRRLQEIDDMDLKGIVRDYIRAARTTTRTTIRGKRTRTGDDLPFEKIGLSFSVGSTDFGVNLSTPINEKFKLRVGGGYMPPIVSMNKSYAVEDNSLRIRLWYPEGQYPNYKVKFKPNFWNFHALASFYPIESVPFHVTGGFYIGENTIQARGDLRHPHTGEKEDKLVPVNVWPLLRVEGYALNIDDGDLNVDLKMGNIIKPYLGVGYGYVVPETNWSFNFDLGLLYQGKYKIHQFGREAPDFIPDPGNIHESDAESIKDISKWKNKVMFWPVLSFQVSYRIY